MSKQTYEQLKLENQLCFPLYACARQVTSLYTPLLKEIGITYTQYITFMVLWEHDGISVGELGRRLYLDNGTLTPLLKKMEAAGYLTRSRSPEDERVVVIRLTGAGLKMRDRCTDIPRQVGGCLPLDPEDAEKLYALLYRILENTKQQ